MNANLVVIIAMALLATIPAVSVAQQLPCSYDQCALRVERNRILAGIEGREVARFNLIGSTDLSALVRGDSATHYAMRFEQKQNSGGAFVLVGSLVVLGGSLWMLTESDGPGWHIDQGAFWAVLGGSAISFAGTIQINQARQAISRAIWWNNRELTRD